MPARIHLKDSAGKPQRGPKHPFWRDHFVCDGRAELEMPAGPYTYEIERGPEFTAASGSFAVRDSDDTNVTVTLKRLTNLAREGWWSGELHVHRPPEDISLLMQAEDLHIAHVITWWNEKTRPVPENVLTRATRHVKDRQVGVMSFGGSDDHFEVRLQRLGVAWKCAVAVRADQSLLEPDDLHLVGRHSRCRQPVRRRTLLFVLWQQGLLW